MYVLKFRRLVRIVDCTLSLASLLALIQFWIWMSDTFSTRFEGFQNISLQEPRKIRDTGSGTTRGKLVSHVWENLCGSNMLRLTKSPMFPKYPDATRFVPNTSVHLYKHFYGQRIFGFLRPPESGFYKFILYSDDNSEFWLSFAGNLTNFRLLAQVGSRDTIASARVGEPRFRSQVTASVFLRVEHEYPIEILHYQGVENDFVELQWIRPGEHAFELIKAEYISYGNVNRPLPLPIHRGGEQATRGSTRSSEVKFYLVATLPDSIHNRALEKCNYTLPRQDLVRGPSSITPLNNVFRNKGRNGNDRWKSDQEAKTLVDLYIKGLDRIFPRRYTPRRVFNLLKFPGEGLYLLELELTTDGLDYTERIVDYVYKTKKKVNETFFQETLCFPRSLQWKDYSVVNLVVAMNTESRWIGRFIDRLQEILEDSLEINLNVVAVHCSKTDYDITAAFRKTSIDRYKVLTLEGEFSRSRALNKGVGLVEEYLGGIILTCDVHVELPPTIFDDARKYCIEGQMVCAPVVYDLDCASHPNADNPKGLWNYHGFEMLGMYKSDWDIVGGMEVSLNDRAADWDILDRLSNRGLFIARPEVPSLFRPYQPKDGTYGD